MELNVVNGSPDARARQTEDKDDSAEMIEIGSEADTSVLEISDVQAIDKVEPDSPLPLSRPYVPKIVELRLRGTPPQIAVHIKAFSNSLLAESGYLPFVFDLPTNLRDPAIEARFRRDATEVPNIIVYPMDLSQPFQPGERSRLLETNLGLIDLLAAARDSHGDTTLLRFKCNELDWAEYEWRLNQLCEMLENRGFLITTENETEQFRPIEPQQGGRASDADYDRAYEEIYHKGRNRTEVYLEWLKRRVRSEDEMLDDPKRAFNKAMKRRRKKEVGTK